MAHEHPYTLWAHQTNQDWVVVLVEEIEDTLIMMKIALEFTIQKEAGFLDTVTAHFSIGGAEAAQIEQSKFWLFVFLQGKEWGRGPLVSWDLETKTKTFQSMGSQFEERVIVGYELSATAAIMPDVYSTQPLP